MTCLRKARERKKIFKLVDIRYCFAYRINFKGFSPVAMTLNPKTVFWTTVGKIVLIYFKIILVLI